MTTGGPTSTSAKLALAIKRLRTERPDTDLVLSDPIAIIGMGCRFPGNVHSPRDFWRLLQNGVDTITQAPPDRWDAAAYFDPDPQAPGKTNSSWGGFLNGHDLFDPVLFGISPREAISMDPQQRLLLEVAWETLWDSGRAPESLAGSRTGVFVAIQSADYERLMFDDENVIGPHSCSGGYRSVASGRISFLLDLRGPSISMDTACSSSLSVVHGACQSLRTGECNLALAGGVNLHLLPGHYVGLAKLGMLAPDGRCKVFDASGDGFVPSDGCGMVALKRLADALADGDRIYAVIRGTALNQDGRTNVLTAPNGLAQRAVIRAALENAQVNPSDVTYVETHGTGTALGDPIEVEALADVLSADSNNVQPCALGAVKTNLGHLEAAAGMAGLIKAALALHHQEIPKNLHFKKLNPHISLEHTRFFLPAATTPWPRGNRPRFAGVSSFGFSGTNGHVVLEESPQVPSRPQPAQDDIRPRVLTISARTPEALQDAARQYRSFLQGDNVSLYDICHSASRRRYHYEERLALTASSREEFDQLLSDFVQGRTRPGIARGRAVHGVAMPVFVCSGQGSQWAGMGVSLCRDEPVFRAAMEECEALIQKHGGWSLIEHVSKPDNQSKLADTEYAQPAIFAMEVALARLWKSWGIEPAAVIGHSAGEVAAAHITGALDLETAVHLAVVRGRLMQATTGQGKMGAVHLPARKVADSLIPYGNKVSIAAINSPDSTVISGDPHAVEELLAMWRKNGIGCRPLPVNYAFHSAQMQASSDELAGLLASMPVRSTSSPMISTVFGRAVRGPELDATYWGRNARRTVQFSAAVQAAVDMGLSTFIEVGPHPVLLGAIGECLGNEGKPENLIPSLRRNDEDTRTLLSSLGTLHASGQSVKWEAVYPKSAPPVTLPAYPYQRQRYWVETQPARSRNQLHPLLRSRLRSPSLKGVVFEGDLDLQTLPYLADHKVEGRPILPMTAFLEMVQLAVREDRGDLRTLTDTTILSPLELRANGSVTVQVVIEDEGFRVFSLQGEEWKLHASGHISGAGLADDPRSTPGSSEFTPASAHYARLAGLGFDFGPAFQTVESLRIAPGEAWVRVRLQEAQTRQSKQYLFHPALLDGCLQAATAAAPDLEGAYLPFHIERLETYRPAGSEVLARAVLRPSTGHDTLCSDIEIVDRSGTLLARVTGLTLRRSTQVKSKIYRIEWRQALRGQPWEATSGKVLIISDEPASGAALAKAFQDRGRQVRVTSPDRPFDGTDGVGAVIRMVEPSVESAVTLVQQIVLRCPSQPPQMWFVTRDAVAANPGDRCEGLRQASVWGMARTVGMEHPELRCSRIDLDEAEPDYTVLAEEIANSDGEEEVAFRGGIRYVPRLAHQPAESGQATQWTIPARGSIDNLALTPMQRIAPGAGEVEVEIEASALNFRDVLNVLGMYPGDPGQPGLEFCGRIARTGSGVNYKPGERVMGLAWGAFASYVTTPAAFVVPAPEGWTPAESATVPNAFLTAWHCLIRIGKLQSGERVLIHAATGGVGLAAVQVAKRAGAEIFATAGSDAKRDWLRSLGISHVFSSRTVDFSQQIAKITGGKGVDLVLNSLAGEFIDAGFEAIGANGRFIEIGKNAIWTSEKVAELEKPVQYFVVDLATVLDSDPDQIQEDLQSLRKGFEERSFQPLPARVFEFEDAPSAFRHMAQAKHIGKVVLRHPAGLQIRPDATYLITGGLGAVGLRAAQWLVDGGARHLVLLGRNTPSSEATRSIEAQRNMGVHVEVRAVDVAQRAELDVILRSLPRLAGVIHAAGVLDDGILMQQNPERIARVMTPKVDGAWNLHELTASTPLDFFILCSSVASLTGSPGQAGYAAGNAFLDALAHYRRVRGFSGLSVNWGAWAEAGMAAKVGDEGRRQSLPGVRSMSAREYFECLQQASAGGNAQVAIVDMDWAQLKPAPRLVSGFTTRPGQPKPASPTDDLLNRLAAAPSRQRKTILLDSLRDMTRRILGLSSSQFIDERQPLMKMGLDSLMAVEFRNQLVSALKRPLSATVLFDHPTLAALVELLEGHDEPAPEERSDHLLEELETLSDLEAEELLKKELERN